MTVGGRIIEIKPVTQRSAENPDFRRAAIRLWCVARNGDEMVVYAKPQDDLPKIGDEIWWQGRRIYYDNDRKYLHKLGYSTGIPDEAT